jgi:hypothetical protein
MKALLITALLGASTVPVASNGHGWDILPITVCALVSICKSGDVYT